MVRLNSVNFENNKHPAHAHSLADLRAPAFDACGYALQHPGEELRASTILFADGECMPLERADSVGLLLRLPELDLGPSPSIFLRVEVW